MSEHPAFTIRVAVGGLAVHAVPNRASDPHLGWALRYAPGLLDDERSRVRLAAAEIVESFEYLCSDAIPASESIRRLRMIRRAWREAMLQPAAQPDNETT